MLNDVPGLVIAFADLLLLADVIHCHIFNLEE
jgi:hypothetical protein